MTRQTNYIVKKIKDGDIHLFEAIYKEHYHALIAYARRFVFSKEDAREIIQDVFVRIWEMRESLPGDIHFRNYLYTSVRNHCLDYLKHRKIVNRYMEKLREETEAAGRLHTIDMENPLDGLITVELQEKITKAIDTLPPKCREVFLMSRFEGMKNREIAALLQLSVKTVETHIGHALKVIRELLDIYLSK